MDLPGKAVAYIEMEDHLVPENASRTNHEYLHEVIYAIQGEPVQSMAGRSQVHPRLIRTDLAPWPRDSRPLPPNAHYCRGPRAKRHGAGRPDVSKSAAS